MVDSIPRIPTTLNFFVKGVLFVTVIPKEALCNSAAFLKDSIHTYSVTRTNPADEDYSLL
jgi:hypothetical protein